MKLNNAAKLFGIQRFSTCKEWILTISKDNICLNNNFLLQESEYNTAFFVGDKYVLYGNINHFFKYNLETNVIEKLNAEWSYYQNWFNSNSILISLNRRKDEKNNRIADYHYFDFSSNILSKKIFTDSPQIKILENNGIICSNNLFLKSISLLTGEYKWEVDLSPSYPTAQIHEIIGVYKNVLLVSLNEGTLLGLDTEKGVILWEMPYQAALKVRFNRGIHLDTEKGLLYCLSGNGFAVIALVNQQVIRSKNDYYVYTEEITEPYQYGYSDAGSAFGLSCWQGDYLYFTASKGTAFYGWLGVFHIPTMEVVWEYQIQNGETFNSPPQVSENKLYVLDTGGTLHIFERENE